MMIIINLITQSSNYGVHENIMTYYGVPFLLSFHPQRTASLQAGIPDAFVTRCGRKNWRNFVWFTVDWCKVLSAVRVCNARVVCFLLAGAYGYACHLCVVLKNVSFSALIVCLYVRARACVCMCMCVCLTYKISIHSHWHIGKGKRGSQHSA